MNQEEFGEKPKGDKPRVLGIVGIGILRGVLSVISGMNTLQEIDRISSSRVPGWLAPAIYLGLALAVITFIAAILIWRYKRLGLQLGAVGFGGDAIVALAMVTLQSDVTIPFSGLILPLAIDFIVLYYIYKYLTSEPEKDYFD